MFDLIGVAADRRRLLLLELVVLPLALGLVVTADYVTPYQLNLSAFYLMVILLAGWTGGQAWGVGYAILCSAAQITVSLLMGSVYKESFYFYFADANILFGYLCVGAIIAKCRAAYLRERAIARIDLLTGLANEESLYERVGYEIARQRRDGLPFALVCIRCLHVRVVNEALGREAGDLVIKSIAAVVRGAASLTDLAARPWGSQFCIVYSQFPTADVKAALDRLEKNLDRLINKQDWPIAVSIGAGIFLTPAVTADDAMAYCGRLVMRARSPGNVNVEMRVYDPADEDAMT